MREIGVHLETVGVVAFERPFERLDIRGAETHLACAVNAVNARILFGQLIDNVAGTVGRAVIDDHYLGDGEFLFDSRDKFRDILALVVGRNADQRFYFVLSHDRRIIAQKLPDMGKSGR